MRTRVHDTSDMQERANDEFRLVIDSRDRGFYTSRADIVIDCRGLKSDYLGCGPGGGVSIGEALLEKEEYQAALLKWLPGDPRFELRHLQNKKLIVYGATDEAIRMVEELMALNSKESLPQSIWIVPPNLSNDTEIDRIKAKLTTDESIGIIESLGIERIEWNADGAGWTLSLLQQDESTVELQGNLLAVFRERVATKSISPSLLADASATDCNSDWAGWM